MADIKLTANQAAVVKYLKENGRVTMTELCEALGNDAKHLTPVVTGLGLGQRGKGLVNTEKVAVENEDKPVKYVFLTEAGEAFEIAE